MKDQVLSIEQMQELEDIGIDVSKASMFWYKNNKFKQLIPCSDRDTIKDWTNQHGENCVIPTFTLQDILEILPKVITTESDNFELYLNTFQCYTHYRDPKHDKSLNAEYGNSILEAAFNMLKWCKQNNYI